MERLTAKDIENVRVLAVTGDWSCPEIADILQLPLGSVQYHAKGYLNHDRNGAGHPPRVLTDRDVETIRRLADEGWTRAETARRFGVSPGHVSKIVLGRAR
mgnify:CR=1 FL=1